MPKRRNAIADPYKRGYAKGVIAAVDALLDDLVQHGVLGFAEDQDDSHALECKQCVLESHHFPLVAARWGFVTHAGHHD